jgi:nitronate monooxygenase
MALPVLLQNRLTLPLVGAPMFLASREELVIAQCLAGMVGTFPSLNARTTEELDAWLTRIGATLAAAQAENPEQRIAPYGVNLILHGSNTRVAADLECMAHHRVPIVITSVGKPEAVVSAVHAWGGIVFHDVTTMKFARKALECGVDGLVLVCAGAGGHGGTMNPFAFVEEVRAEYDGTVLLAGALSTGRAIRAALDLGADLAYMGTRFLVASEAHVPAPQQSMLLEATMADIVYTAVFSGIPANYLGPSIAANGVDVAALVRLGSLPGTEGPKDIFKPGEDRPKAWKEVWSAGQGVGALREVLPVAEIVARLQTEFAATRADGTAGMFRLTSS